MRRGCFNFSGKTSPLALSVATDGSNKSLQANQHLLKEVFHPGPVHKPSSY